MPIEIQLTTAMRVAYRAALGKPRIRATQEKRWIRWPVGFFWFINILMSQFSHGILIKNHTIVYSKLL